MQQAAENLYDEGYLTYYENCSLDTIGNSLTKLVQQGVLLSQKLIKGYKEE